jgi:hypothetical protein
VERWLELVGVLMSHFSSIVAALISDASAAGRSLLSAVDAAAQRTLLSVYSAAEADAAIAAAVGASAGATHSSGTLAARALLTPAAGDTYAVTSGVAAGDRYACFVAGVWTLASYDRTLLLPGTTPWAHWPFNEAAGTFASVGSQSGMTLTGSGGVISYGAPQSNGRVGVALGSPAILTGPTTAPASARRCTLLGWTDYTTLGTYGSLAAYNGSGSPYGAISLGLVTGSQPRGFYATVGNPAHNAVAGSPATATPNRCRLYAAVWDGDAAGARFKLYVDARLVYSGTPTAGADLDWGLTGGRWCIGNNPFGEAVTGLYSDFAVYDGTALTSAQLSEVYRRGVGTYGGQ